MTKLTLKKIPQSESLRQISFDKQKECLDFLCKRFPQCFSRQSPKPLKINILNDIMDVLGEKAPFSKSTLRKTLQFYCHNFNYLNSVMKISRRFGLDGQEAGNVDSTHLTYTTEKIQKIRQKHLQKIQRRCTFKN
jgi:ProP effector